MSDINTYQIDIPHKYRLPPSENVCITEKGTKIIVDPKCKCIDVLIEK